MIMMMMLYYYVYGQYGRIGPEIARNCSRLQYVQHNITDSTVTKARRRIINEAGEAEASGPEPQ